MRFPRVLSAAVALSAVLAVTGCRNASTSDAGPVKHYQLTGKVVGTNAESHEVEVDAAAIPGFMDAMTMPYALKNPDDLKQIHRGDQIQGTLDVDGNGATLDHVTVLSRANEQPQLNPQSLTRPIRPGTPVPDFALLDQDNKVIHLDDYAGKVLLVTFIYTHCPLADYCPRMSHQFADINKSLQADPSAYGATHLLSISFDPKRDTPAVLRSYGGAYTGQYTNEKFDHWTFAAPQPSDLQKVLAFFDVGAVPAPGGTLTHTLSTIAIGRDGRILQWWPGNQWTSAQALAAIHQALGARA